MKASSEKADQVVVVEIWETAGGFVFRVQEPSGFMQPLGPVVTESSVRVSRPTIGSLCRRLERLVHTPGAGVEDFKACARALFDQLISSWEPEFRIRIGDSGMPLLISIKESEIVWEALHDGEDFLGLKYTIARQIRTGVRPPALPTKQSPSRCLVVANPTGEKGLKALENQAQSMIQHLRGLGVQCRYLARGRATPEEVLIELSSGKYDIFHYSGHVARVDESGNCAAGEGPGEFALQLAGGWLRGFEIEQAAREVGVVFLNGCQSARSVESLTGAFLRKGAALVIGTVFKVSSHGAQVFAERFYDHALRGKQAGEAFRAARRAVSEDSRCGNDWACFVMYGNPCLRIIGATLPAALRKSYDESCRRVIEDCIRFSEKAGAVCTPFLFAAMLGGEDPALRDGLRARGVSADDLRRIFEEAWKQDAGRPGDGARLEVSGNVIEIIGLAEEEAAREGRDYLTEGDLLAGFIRQGGGAMGELLRKAGVDFGIIGGAGEKSHELQWCSIPGEGFTDEARAVVRRAADIARGSGGGVVGSPHLFLALAEQPPDELARFFKRYQVSLTAFRRWLEKAMGVSSPAGPAAARIEPSENLAGALREAESAARASGRDRVAPRDLLRGLAKQGGGAVGKFLSRHLGLELGVMYSDLFTDQGELDMIKLDPSAAKILERAAAFAGRTGWRSISTPHLVMGFCSLAEGLTAQLVRDQGMDPGQIVQLIGARFSGGGERPVPKLNLKSMSPRLLRILALSERAAGEEGGLCPGERHLLQAFLLDGGGETARALREMGLDLERLEREPVREVKSEIYYH